MQIERPSETYKYIVIEKREREREIVRQKQGDRVIDKYNERERKYQNQGEGDS